MKIKMIALIAVLTLLLACTDKTEKNNVTDAENITNEETSIKQQDQNLKFEEFKNHFIEELWKINPNYALYAGYYKFDDQLVIPNEERNKSNLKFINTTLESLKLFDLAQLNNNNSSDYYIIKNEMDSSIWYLNEFRSSEWNPASYSVAGAFGLILNTEYKSIDERLRVIGRRLTNVPAYYQSAIENITNPTLEHTILAIQQNKGALGVFNKNIPASLENSSLSDVEKSAIKLKLDLAVTAISDYVSWLQDKKEKIADGSARDFRIGAELYEKKFKFDIFSDYSAKESYDKAVQAKQDLHVSMIKISKGLWPKYFPAEPFPQNELLAVKKLIDHLSVKHIDRNGFVDEVRRQIPILEAYINQADLLDMDPSRPLVVRETPEYQRGIAGASVNSPGPYDATANTYYNVTPLDDYTDEQAESYLREYNHWILQILNIHEALPGHYVQLVHANKSPSIIKSIFGNGAMIEGWAVYSERMMLESGYGNNEPELWLMYNKWNMRVVVNTILDYSVQVLGMSEEDGLDLLMNQAFQERTEAEGKWRRATLSQVQLTSYFNGSAEIYDFRESVKKEMGSDFDLKSFHNEFLSYGSAPVPIIKKLMQKSNKHSN